MQHLYRELAPGTIVYMRSINAGRQVGYRFVLEQWEGDRLREKWMASKARWIEEEQWRVSNLRERWWDGMASTSRRWPVLDTALAMSIYDFGQRNEAMSTLGRRELKEAIAREKARGSGGERLLQLERHTRTSNAFAIYVMTLIGVSVASRRNAGDRHSPPHRRGDRLRLCFQCQADLRVGDSCRRSARGRRLDAQRLVRPARHCPVSKGPQVRRSPPGFVSRGTARSRSAIQTAASAVILGQGGCGRIRTQ